MIQLITDQNGFTVLNLFLQDDDIIPNKDLKQSYRKLNVYLNVPIDVFTNRSQLPNYTGVI